MIGEEKELPPEAPDT